MRDSQGQEAGKATTGKAPSRLGGSDLGRELASLRQDMPDDGFNARLRQALTQAGPPAAERGWFHNLVETWRDRLADRPMAVGMLSGAMVAAALILSFQHFSEPGQGETNGTVATRKNEEAIRVKQPYEQKEEATTLPKDKVALIRFEFHSEVSIEDAEFHIELPEGLVFWSEGRALADARFSWTGALEAGNNTVVTAVRASREGRYRVLATAWVEGEPLIHEVTLQVVASAQALKSGGTHEG